MTYFDDRDILLDIRDLQVSFPLTEGVVKAVNGVDLKVCSGEILGLAGESGCGKSITAQSIMRIVDQPGRIDKGTIALRRSDGSIIDVTTLKRNHPEIRDIRGQEVSMIFQEPMSSFSPVYTIGRQLMEAVMAHQDINKKKAKGIVVDLLERVGIPNATQRVDEYPFEFSGGMRQRAMIAMALSCHPSLLIADEPTTALDVTIQAQILRLMKEIQEEFGMAIIFITHNLGVIAQIADRIAIMYLGKIVEEGLVKEIFDSPKHPYTINLLRAIPKLNHKRELQSIRGSVPGPFEEVTGCAFHQRCDQYMSGTCDNRPPEVTEVSETHLVRCFLHSKAKG
jgi:peptide/nickel transport system ATP-binding protein